MRRAGRLRAAGPVGCPSPAIRPGLRCGSTSWRCLSSRGIPPRPSGRGSVAALRRVRRHGNIGGPSPAIRPGLRCGDTIAPNYEGPAPPLPGHQAGAPLRRDDAPAAVAADCCPSPAIRPGLRCGVIPVLVRLAFCTSLPGHQAGAPLRRRPRAGDDQRRRSPSPAIRPGLRCGDGDRFDRLKECLGPPRPSGRGSVAAASTTS